MKPDISILIMYDDVAEYLVEEAKREHRKRRSNNTKHI
jgi:hypothetical protein